MGHSFRGGGEALDYFLVRLELFYLIGAEKYRRVSDLSLIFFCILDEAVSDEEESKVYKIDEAVTAGFALA